MSNPALIQTGVDQLVELVKKQGRISFQDAGKELGVSTEVITEWADFLEEEGIVGIDYKLTRPYLVEKKLTKAEIDTKAKEFTSKKDIFIRKAEGALGFLEREADNMKKIKAEFDKLKKELGIELDVVKDELDELEKYEEKKEELSNKVLKEESQAEKQLEVLSQSLKKEQRQYADIISQIKHEEQTLEVEKEAAQNLEAKEKELLKEIDHINELANQLQKKVLSEQEVIKHSEENILHLERVAHQIREQIEKEGRIIEPLIKRKDEHERAIKDLQDKITKKVAKHHQSKKEQRVSEKVQSFFNNKMKVATLIDKLNKDRVLLEKDLNGLVKKAKAFQLTTKKRGVEKDIADIEKKFLEVEKRKDDFESEFRKLTGLLKI